MSQLTKEQSWGLIQEGYNPIDPEDVQRYLNNEKPKGELQQEAAQVKRENLGNGRQNDNNDYNSLAREHGFDSAGGSSSNDPREQLNHLVNTGYGNTGDQSSRIDEQIRNKLAMGQQKQQMLEQRGPIQPLHVPQQDDRRMIRESRGANEVGRQAGVNYINAFIALLKKPSSPARQNLIERINEMVTMEENITPENIKFYRGAIAQAEKEMYAKIKKTG